MADDELYSLSYYVAKGAVWLEPKDFVTSGTKEFLQASILLEKERMKRFFEK